MNDTNNNMTDVYKRRYELCLKRNKEIKKTILIVKIDLNIYRLYL